MDAATKARVEVADLIARLVAAGADEAEARECALLAYLRGQRSRVMPWEDEVTPVVDVIEVDPSEAETTPNTPRAIRRSRVVRKR